MFYLLSNALLHNMEQKRRESLKWKKKYTEHDYINYLNKRFLNRSLVYLTVIF